MSGKKKRDIGENVVADLDWIYILKCYHIMHLFWRKSKRLVAMILDSVLHIEKECEIVPLVQTMNCYCTVYLLSF